MKMFGINIVKVEESILHDRMQTIFLQVHVRSANQHVVLQSLSESREMADTSG